MAGSKPGSKPYQVQNKLKSFLEYALQLSEDIRKGADFLIPLETTDSTDFMLDLKMYKKYLNPYAGNLSVEAFAEFMKHLGFCAREYRLATVREAMRWFLMVYCASFLPTTCWRNSVSDGRFG